MQDFHKTENFEQTSNNYTEFEYEKITPLKFVIKYNPPLIGLFYKRHVNDKKKYIYNILFNNLINLPSSEEIT